MNGLTWRAGPPKPADYEEQSFASGDRVVTDLGIGTVHRYTHIRTLAVDRGYTVMLDSGNLMLFEPWRLRAETVSV